MSRKILFSLGLTGPLLAAMPFVDELAVLGTNVDEECVRRLWAGS
ncbi:MAG: hypothetical protein Q4C66_13815 [Lachnospiraceae bacterium]|nr:hypothetical protein [Lachnospiraceae bacterium]